jgi:type IV pilus assembly protein PilC
MPKYLYVGVTASGTQVKGEIVAPSRNEVATLLRKRKIRPLSVKNKPLELSIDLFSKISLKDISRFTRQFSAMTSSGLPLVQCLDILAEQTESKRLALIVRQVSMDIQGGSNLADAFRKHPKAFNNLYCNMVAAGEASGNLDGILTRLAEYQERAEALRRKIKGALTYPGVVSFIAVVVTYVMLSFVVPTFAQMFVDFGGALPAPTRIVMGLSDFVRNNAIFLFLGTIAFFVSLNMYYRTPAGRLALDTLKLKVPILGDLERKSSISRFSQTLSTLLASGITILDALSITSKIASNMVLVKGIERTLERITGGQSISEPLKETGVFPPMVVHMIAVGERTGDLSGMLAKISEFYEEEVNAAVDALTSVIEPILIVFLGVVIGGILMAMYLPMFDMMNMIG